ncbi:MAG: bifunctional hydroxymethylpyrimidine kinase/phosphomethylpyrimidine kinase [Eubacteriales bacterium]|nr:bifunctional hydroxymethylpyrimidine kinase/phosphomethylpyrimidine kinase [Eubacteriales bacterium]
MKKVLTIAGSDSSGGAGIQADIKTMTVHGVYAMSVVTALTAQNTTGVSGVQTVTPEFLKEQLDCIFSDIYPDAVKIGMLGNAELIRAAAESLRRYPTEHVVLDPVMVSTSGSRLLDQEAVQALVDELAGMAELMTPNLPETEALTGLRVRTPEEMERAALLLYERTGCQILCKGGHLTRTADDLLCMDGRLIWIGGKRISNPNSHGTGCTLSSAIACNLALGHGLESSVRRAKAYLNGALEAGLDLGKGSGPLDHMYALRAQSYE